MKIIFFLAGLCLSSPALADTWNCPIKDETRPPGYPEERVAVEFDQALQTVTYVHQVLNSDGTFAEEPEALYSKVARIRGGVPIAYCQSDYGNIALEYKMVNWGSKCATADKQMPLFFNSDFRLDQPGFIQIQILDSTNGNNVNRHIRIDACK